MDRCWTAAAGPASTPGSPLAAAMAGLADAVDALASVTADDEHVGVVGDAVVVLGHLQPAWTPPCLCCWNASTGVRAAARTGR